MLLTPYGVRVWGPATLAAIALGVAFGWLGWWWAVAVVALIWLAVAMFFRDPLRRIPIALPPGTMLSPADGTVSAVTRVDDHEATGGPALVVRIFLSVLNVHVNRAPCAARAVRFKYTPGRFLDARTAESAEVNESNLIVLRIDGDETIGVRQVAGKVARRIVCGLGVGDELRQGQRFGMIRFGSTTELILPRPDDAKVQVREGDRVRGGITVLATLQRASSS